MQQEGHTVRPKLIIKFKPRTQQKLAGELLTQSNYRTVLNQYVLRCGLQTPERMFILIDSELSNLTGLETDSIVRITVLHQSVRDKL